MAKPEHERRTVRHVVILTSAEDAAIAKVRGHERAPAFLRRIALERVERVARKAVK